MSGGPCRRADGADLRLVMTLESAESEYRSPTVVLQNRRDKRRLKGAGLEATRTGDTVASFALIGRGATEGGPERAGPGLRGSSHLRCSTSLSPECPHQRSPL